MGEQKLRIGFIGAGSHSSMCIYPTLRMGGDAIYNQIKLPVQLVAVADKDEAKARLAARDFGAGRFYTNHLEMLDKEKLDAVFIVVGGKYHTQLCLDALERGLPVFVEKPAAENVADSLRIIAASRRAKKPVMVAFMKRFATAHVMAKKVSRLPEFGGVKSVHAKMTGFYCLDYYIHYTDLVHFFGGDVSELVAYEQETDGKVGGYSIAFQYAGGGSGAMSFVDRGAGVPSERIEINGVRHFCTVDNVTAFRYYRDPKAPWSRPEQTLDPANDCLAWEPNWTMPRDDNSSLFHLGYVGEVAHFVNSILEGKEPQSTCVDAHKALVLWDAIVASKGKIVKLNYGI